MKKQILILAAAVMGLAACHSGSSSVKNFIPGTYTASAKSEYSIANDTLVIEADHNGGDNVYRVTRKTGYQRITNGKLQPLQHQVKHWSGAWDEQKQNLQILQTGNYLIFYPDKGSLLNGNSEYKKL